LQLPMAVAPKLQTLRASIHMQQGGFLQLPGLPKLNTARLTIVKTAVGEEPVLTLSADSFVCQVMCGRFQGPGPGSVYGRRQCQLTCQVRGTIKTATQQLT
jgi:hypothetical protein